jgi:hypothetical protein
MKIIEVAENRSKRISSLRSEASARSSTSSVRSRLSETQRRGVIKSWSTSDSGIIVKTDLSKLNLK